VFGFSAKDVYVAGRKLFHSTGDGQWSAVDVPDLSDAMAVLGDAQGNLYVGARGGVLFVRKNGTWSHTTDKGAGDYQALVLTGDDLYIGAERFLEWSDPE
jgi:hypothetical protein